MNIDNITSEDMTLTYNGIAMQIKVYEGEIERLHSVIKEVREYIEQNEVSITTLCPGTGIMNTKDYVLEILDKANKEE